MPNNPSFEIKPIAAFEPGSIVEIHTKNTIAERRPLARLVEYRLAEAGCQPAGNMIVQMMKMRDGELVEDERIIDRQTMEWAVITHSYAGSTKARAAIVYKI